MFGFGKRAKEKTRAKELLNVAFQVREYSEKVSGPDAVDFVEAVMWAWNLVSGDEPIDGIDTDDDVKRDLKLDAAARLIQQASTTSSVSRRLGYLSVAVELQAQFTPHLNADLAREFVNGVIEQARRKAVAMVAASGGKNEGENDAKAVMRHIGYARATGDREKSAALLKAASTT
ncbi:hypothetical protein [Mesorhizobium sp. DCY119]|uniref:hypothetical protein n=1 Tax=Mesorhizobium sp. DCY119 TaxID=2108445 RepID=UPI000E6D1341|nr:hypothetical protein [Mesorhizobium sp. DCY119]RJG43719.1 hypothetical protein D3Y55_05230 [Mesorhizobium sp. DCY119]